MAKAKKKLLPKDFEALLKEGNLETLKSIFDHCDVNARGGYGKQTTLAFNACPDELARWLVEHGADIAAQDPYGETPLHARARHWQGRIDVLLELGADVNARDSRGNTPLHYASGVGNLQTTRLLLERGAGLDALNNEQLTPLALALRGCSNSKIENIAAVAELLLEAQAPKPGGIVTLTNRLFGGGKRGRGPVTS